MKLNNLYNYISSGIIRILITVACLILVFQFGSLSANDKTDFSKGEEAFASGNYELAYKIWLPLAEKGNPDAQWGIGMLYLFAEGAPSFIVEAVVEHGPTYPSEQGVYWLRKSAEQGFPDAMGTLSGFYERGLVVEKDLQEALNWKVKAAKTGDALAQYNLGVVYLNGNEIVEKNIPEALRLFELAAKQQLGIAHYNLGVLFFKGELVNRDLVRAYTHFGLIKTGEDKVFGKYSVMYQNAESVIKELEEIMTHTQIKQAKEAQLEWQDVK